MRRYACHCKSHLFKNNKIFKCKFTTILLIKSDRNSHRQKKGFKIYPYINKVCYHCKKKSSIFSCHTRKSAQSLLHLQNSDDNWDINIFIFIKDVKIRTFHELLIIIIIGMLQMQ